jgi:hypothetical protein
VALGRREKENGIAVGARGRAGRGERGRERERERRERGGRESVMRG